MEYGMEYGMEYIMEYGWNVKFHAYYVRRGIIFVFIFAFSRWLQMVCRHYCFPLGRQLS